MENTLENKAKFFAQYWGQEVLTTFFGSGFYIDRDLYPISSGSFFLVLKPLSSITDEDAGESGYDNAKSMLSDNYLVNSPYVFDYLRSRGYALPWMGLSVEQLIEYGWVKLIV